MNVLPVDGGTRAEPELAGSRPAEDADRIVSIALSRAAMQSVRASAGGSRRGIVVPSPASEVGGSAGGSGGGSGGSAMLEVQRKTFVC